MGKVRILAALWALSLTVTLLCGCAEISGGAELRNRLIVQAVGVDWMNGAYQLTLQVLKTGGKAGEEEFQQEVATGRGETVAAAFGDAEKQQGKKVFLGNNRLIVLGRDLAEKGLDYTVDYFNSNHESRPTVVVAISQTSAEDILTAKADDELISAEDIEKKLDGAHRNWPVGSSQLISIMECMMLEGKDPFLPALEVKKAEEGSEISLAGSGVFRDSRMVGLMDLEQTWALLWAAQKHPWSVVPLEDEKLGKLSLEVGDAKARILSHTQGEIPFFTIHVKVETTLMEEIKAGLPPLAEEDLPRIENALERKVALEMAQALETTLAKNKSDMLGLGEILHKFDPDYWRVCKGRWRDILPDVGYEIIVECKIQKVETRMISR